MNRILFFVFILKEVSGLIEGQCPLHKDLLPKGYNIKKGKTITHFDIFGHTEIFRQVYPDFGAFANQTETTVIPREVVMSFLKPNYNLSIGFNVHHPTNVTNLKVNTTYKSDYNYSF